jgi:hypothetical protein
MAASKSPDTMRVQSISNTSAGNTAAAGSAQNLMQFSYMPKIQITSPAFGQRGGSMDFGGLPSLTPQAAKPQSLMGSIQK